MAGELGKASLDLEANLTEFRRNIAEGEKSAGGMRHSLEAVAAISKIAEEALQRVKMKPGQGAESRASAEGILTGVRGISDDALRAARELDKVKLTERQAAESKLAAAEIDSGLNRISRNADQAKRKLAEVRILGGIPGRSGVGVGPIGSGYGRVGLLGAGIGLGALTAPAAGPAAAGLLAAIPTLAFGAVGAVGTLVLAFKGMGKAIGGDLKAFKELEPAQQKFVLTIRSLTGWIDRLKQTAGKNLFPGLTEGLRSALSPGTVSAISKAVAEFASAIGRAGAQWGRYFGSAQFQRLLGPLMQAGARNLFVLSQAMLHLFDALAVLGRAAIPFTNWLITAADKGALLASSWLRAKDASGGLAHAMTEAQTSLRLVGGLLVAVGRAVGALGRALYPVAKIAVKALTDGFNGLAKIIDHNRVAISIVMTGAIHGLVSAIKLASAGIRFFTAGLHHLVGQKASVISTILLIGAAIALTMGPQAAAITGAIIAIGLIARHWKALSRFMVAAMHAAWNGIKGIVNLGVYGILVEFDLIAKGVAKAFGWIPIIGPKIKAAFGAFDGWVKGFRERGLAEFGNAGAQMGAAWGELFGGQVEANLKAVTKAFDEWTGGHQKKALNDLAAQGFTTDLLTGKKIPAKVPQTDVPDIDWGNFGDTTGAGSTDVFGTPPPFDKNVPKPKKGPKAPVIPAAAKHAEALASANANRASLLHNVGGTAKRYLEAELADLNVAVKAIREKYAHATGRARTELFAALTRDENKIRSVRELIGKATQKNRHDELQLAIEEATAAVEGAKKGTAAYDRAVAAEEEALRAMIRYLDGRAHNHKLSVAARTKAFREEAADEKKLKELLKPETAAKAGANEQQFLSAFQQIVKAYAPNAFPKPASNGKTDTHLYNAVHELRQQTALLQSQLRRGMFPGSWYSGASAEAVAG